MQKRIYFNGTYIYDGVSSMLFKDVDNTDSNYCDELFINKHFTILSNEIENHNSHKDNNIINNKSVLIILHITHTCNMRCKYCVYTNTMYSTYRKQDDFSMDLDTAITIIKSIMNTFDLSTTSFIVGFYGGEPLLKFDIISDIVAYLSLNYRNVKIGYNITTNGLLLSQKVCKFLIENEFNISVSLDAPKEIHDKYRIKVSGASTYDIVLDNIYTLMECFPTYFLKNLKFSATYHTPNEIKEGVRFFDDNLLYKVYISMVQNANDPTLPLSTERLDLEYFIEKFITSYYNMDINRMFLYGFPFLEFCRKFDERFIYGTNVSEDNSYSKGFCIPFTNTFHAFRDKSLTFCNCLEGLKWGKVCNDYAQIDNSSVNSLLKWRKDYAHTYCSKCWAKKICNICWLHVLDAEGKIKEKVFSKCAEEKTRLERLITIYIRLKQIDSNIFAILRDRASQNLKKGTTT